MKNVKRLALTTALTATVAAAFGPARVHSNLDDAVRAHVSAPDASIAEQPEQADIAVATHATIDVPAGCAYAVLADIEGWTRWDRSIRKTAFVRGRRATEGSVFLQDFGRFKAHARILSAEPGRRLRWRGQDPTGGPVGVHTWTFVPQADGKTLVINDEHFHGRYMRPLGWFTDLGVSAQFDTTIRDLEAEAKRRCGGAQRHASR